MSKMAAMFLLALGLASAAIAASPSEAVTPPTNPTDDWNIDLLVDTFPQTDSGRLALDHDTNGDLYVGLLKSRRGGPDTACVYRSTDAGATWNRTLVATGDSLGGRIRDYALRVGRDSLGTLLHNFLALSGGSGLVLLRCRPDMSETLSVQVAPGPGIRSVSADRNTEVPERVFVAWDTDSDSVLVAASDDCGLNWPVSQVLLEDNARPVLCAGGDGNVYLAAQQRESLWIDVAACRQNLAGPDVTFRKLDSSGQRRSWNASVASDRDAPDSAQTAIALYCQRDSAGRVSIHSAASVDGGRAWAASIWPPINVTHTTWDIRLPSIRRSYDNSLFRAIATVHEPTRSWDTLVYAFARGASPTTWEQRQSLNNFRASRDVGPVVDYNPAQLGGCIAYLNYALTGLYFDSYGFTGIEEEPSPAARAFRAAVFGSRLRLTLNGPRRVRVTATDCAGRVAAAPFSGALGAGTHILNLLPATAPAACYFARIETDGSTQTLKFVWTR